MYQKQKIRRFFLKREWKWFLMFWKDLRTNQTSLSFLEKFFAYRKGFLVSIMSFSGINRKNYKQYLSSKAYCFSPNPNGCFASTAENKLNIPYLLKDYPEYVPAYYFYKDASGFLPLLAYKGDKSKRLDFYAFSDLLNEKKILACKPCFSRWGEGFMKVEVKEEKYFINGNHYPVLEFMAEILSLNDYIITEYVQQHPYAQAVHPESVNTIRMLCIWDYDAQTFFLARCFQRFGTSHSVVDNLKSGSGMAVLIDPETGVLSDRILVNIEKKGYRNESVLKHPDTDIFLPGIQIPHWNTMKEKIIEISNRISFIKYMGYDVVITPDSFKILEINSKSGLNTLQVYDPLFTDLRIKKSLMYTL